MPGDRNNVGGILGIDPRSFDRTTATAATTTAAAAVGTGSGTAAETGGGGLETVPSPEILRSAPGMRQNPVMVTLVREPPKGPAVSASATPAMGKKVA